jgi:WD40 repeat protein
MLQVTKIATYTGHRDCVYALSEAENNLSFFSASGDGMVVHWDFDKPDQGEMVAKVDNSVYALAYDLSRNLLLIGNNFKGMHVIDLQSKKEIKNLHFTTASIFDIKIANGHVCVACGDGSVYLLRLDDFSLVFVLRHSDSSARCLAYNSLNDHLAVGYSDHYIRIFTLSNGLLLHQWEGHSNSVFTLAYSPNGNELLSGGRDAHLKIWDAPSYQAKKSVVAHMYAINHLAYSPDGTKYATGSMDKSVKVWDAQTHRLLKVIDRSRHAGHGTSVNKLLWTKHHDWLVSASDDRSVSVWEIAS